MSTRSEILVKCSFGSCKLYHHHDGYIEGVGFDLYERFFAKDGEWFNRKNYEGKQIIPSASDIVNSLVKDADEEYEITFSNHIDIEYYYEIDVEKGTLTGWSVDYIDYDEKTGNRLKEYKMVKYNKYGLNEIKELYNKWIEKKKQREEDESRDNIASRVQDPYPLG